jgi:translation elongation factor EF-Tu-like GTPase
MFVRFLTEEAGDNVGILLRGIQKTLKEEWLFVSQVQLNHTLFKS